MRNLNTPGIILKKYNSGEYDQFVTIYCPGLGKIQAFAKGSRRIESSFTGHLETLNICHFQLYKSSNNFTITQCQAETVFKNVRNDFTKSMIAMIILEIFQRTTSASEDGEDLFYLLEKTLRFLSQNPKHLLCLESFKIKLLNLLGVMPDISCCSLCEKKWQLKQTIFLSNDGDLSCISCHKEPKKYQEISFNIMKLIHFLMHKDFKETANIKLTLQEEEDLKHISNAFLQRHINSELQTERIMASL